MKRLDKKPIKPTEPAGAFSDRLEEIARAVGGKRELAKAVNLSEAQLYRYLSGDSQPTLNVLINLAVAGNVNLDWLATGKGSKIVQEERLPKERVLRIESKQGELADFKLLEVFTKGSLPVSDKSKKKHSHDIPPICVHMPWMKYAVSKNADEVFLMEVMDDSMSPTFNVGDFILADPKINRSEYIDDGIYILADKDMAIIRRIQNVYGGKVEVSCDNPKRSDMQKIDRKSFHERDLVLGRVAWQGKRL